MKMSPSIASLAAAMAKAQAAMGGAHKDSSNPAFNSKYADLSSVVDAIKPHLTANGLAYFQFVHTSSEGVGVETLLTHASGEYVAGDPFYVPVAKANAHGFGSALTYARRYSLAAVCGLKADDDDGNAAAEHPPAPVEVPQEHVLALESAESIDELAATWQRIPPEFRKPLAKAKDAAKKRLLEPA